jgi:hypothetical protein
MSSHHVTLWQREIHRAHGGWKEPAGNDSALAGYLQIGSGAFVSRLICWCALHDFTIAFVGRWMGVHPGAICWPR